MTWVLIVCGIVLAVTLAVVSFDSEAHYNTRFLCRLGSVLTTLAVAWGLASTLGYL